MTTKISKGIAALLAALALLITGCDDPNQDEGQNGDIQQEQNEDGGENQENGDNEENEGGGQQDEEGEGDD